MLLSSDSGSKKRENHVIPSNVLKANECKLKETPLCTLIVSFTDDEANDVTSAHVFTMTTPQLYPQTRKTVYKSGSSSLMSLTSTPFSTDDERYAAYANSPMSPPVQKPLIQEVSLSYSAPYTSTVKASERDLPLAFSPYSLDSEYERIEDLHSHTYNDSRLSRRSNSTATKADSVERLLNTGRKETEFSARAEPVPYFSAQSAIKAGRITPASTPRGTPRDTPISFDQTLTARLESPLSQNLIVSESTTFEELTTITTSKNRTTRKQETKTDMPTVNALTKQFEMSSQQERVAPLRPRKHSNSLDAQNGNVKSRSRVVVIDKSEKNSNYTTNRSGVVYSPGAILTTTIVDIEPARFGRRTEEYKIQEEYIVHKYDNGPPNYQRQDERYRGQQTREYRSYPGKQDNYKGRSQSAAENREVDIPVDTSPIDVVKNVIDRWETKLAGTTTALYANDQQLRSVSRVDMNDNISRSAQERIIVHQRSESQPVERVIPISPIPLSVEPIRSTHSQGIAQTYEESKTVVLKQAGDPVAEPAVPRAQTSEVIVSPPLKETILSPPPIPTPSPTLDVAEEELFRTDETVTTQHTTVSEHSILNNDGKQKKEKENYDYITDNKGVEKHAKEQTVEVEIHEKWETDGKPKSQEPPPNSVSLTQTNEKVLDTKSEEVKNEEYLHKFLDRDYRIKTYEEWSTTKRLRDRSQPPERPPTSHTSYSDRSRSIDRSYERRTLGSGMSRTYSEGRGLASGPITGGTLRSGMSSAGAICTTQIRDAREREKREIGLLNDRLADYIEKVRFLEAQNQCISHDIEILRRGFSGSGHVSGLFNTEIAQAKLILEKTLAGRSLYDKDIAVLSSDVEAFRKKWRDAVSSIKAHREDHNVDLDKLSKIEAEISLFKRKIRIVEEDVIRISRENDGVRNEIGRTRQQINHENALKNERSLNVQDLLQRIKLLQTENSTKIEQELIFIRRDTTSDNREYFRRELQAAIRDIRADYEAISIRNSQDIEIWYRETIKKIHAEAPRYNPDVYKEELVSIRSTVTGLRSRLAEVEGRNFFLLKLIEDLKNNDESKLYEISLAEKDAQIARLRDQCTELSIQMEKLCEHEISIRAEIERYRILLGNANVTTYTANIRPSSAGISVGGVVSGNTRVVSHTTTTHSSTNLNYSGIPASRNGYTVNGNIAGISVGGTVGAQSASGRVSGAGSGTYQRIQ